MENKKPRWEVKYEDFLSRETEIQSKIQGESSQLEELKAQIRTTANRKRQELFAKINELDESIQKYKESKEYKDFENFQNNKTQLANIYEYKKILVKKIEQNERIINDHKDSQAKRQSNIAEKNEKIEKNNARIEELYDDIGKGTDPDTEKKQEEVRSLLKENENLGLEITKMKDDYVKEEAKDEEMNKAKMQNEKYERRLAKCNIIGAGLMKGKELQDISLELIDDKQTEPVKTTGSLKDHMVQYTEQAMEEEENDSSSIEQEEENDSSSLEQEEEENDSSSLEQEEEKEETFETKHPRLAKISKFFKKLFRRDKEEDLKDEKETTKEEEQQEEERQEEQSENEILKEIALHGVEAVRRKLKEEKEAEEEARKSDLKERLRVRRAEAEARDEEKYGYKNNHFHTNATRKEDHPEER